MKLNELLAESRNVAKKVLDEFVDKDGHRHVIFHSGSYGNSFVVYDLIPHNPEGVHTYKLKIAPSGMQQTYGRGEIAKLNHDWAALKKKNGLQNGVMVPEIEHLEQQAREEDDQYRERMRDMMDQYGHLAK